MKWLEGWFGAASGVLGIVWIALVGLLAPVSTQTGYGGSSTCMSSSDGVTQCYSPDAAVAPGPNVGLLIVLGVTFLLFAGVLIGTWLDLRGARTAGRVILLTSATLLIFMPFLLVSATKSFSGVFFAFVLPQTLLAFVAGILACVRRDAPRATAAAG